MTKNKLTIDEIVQKKEHIEKVILTILQDFHYETCLTIESVDLYVVDKVDGKNYPTSLKLNVKL